MGQETKNLETVIRLGVQEALFNIHTSIPAQVVSFNAENGSIQAQPVLQRMFEGETEPVSLPIINDVPVVYPSSGKFKIRFPLEKGDYVLLCFSERSTDIWKKSGGVVDPKDYRKFHLSDAFAIPGGNPLIQNGPISDAIEITSENGKIRITNEGKVKVENSSNELISVLVELLEKMIAAQVVTGIGPQPFLASTISDFTLIKSKIETFKE